MDGFYVVVFVAWFFIGLDSLLGTTIRKFSYGIMWVMALTMLAMSATANLCR